MARQDRVANFLVYCKEAWIENTGKSNLRHLIQAALPLSSILVASAAAVYAASCFQYASLQYALENLDLVNCVAYSTC